MVLPGHSFGTMGIYFELDDGPLLYAGDSAY
jgi:glyoxylase-like metal-dependent hydrolase (beta-lactamase superfamily II)